MQRYRRVTRYCEGRGSSWETPPAKNLVLRVRKLKWMLRLDTNPLQTWRKNSKKSWKATRVQYFVMNSGALLALSPLISTETYSDNMKMESKLSKIQLLIIFRTWWHFKEEHLPRKRMKSRIIGRSKSPSWSCQALSLQMKLTKRFKKRWKEVSCSQSHVLRRRELRHSSI